MTPESPQVQGVITGLTVAGELIAALFFLRFWRRTRDGLFLAFSAAFLLMAIANPVPLVFAIPDESQAPIYTIRLIAFLLIILAILRKNMQGRR